jgi:hypothetical protein
VFLLLGTKDNPQPSNPLTWVFISAMALFLGSLLALLILMAGRRAKIATEMDDEG